MGGIRNEVEQVDSTFMVSRGKAANAKAKHGKTRIPEKPLRTMRNIPWPFVNTGVLMISVRIVSAGVLFLVFVPSTPAGYYSSIDRGEETLYSRDFDTVFLPALVRLRLIPQQKLPPDKVFPMYQRYLLIESMARDGKVNFDLLSLEQKLNYSTVLIRQRKRRGSGPIVAQGGRGFQAFPVTLALRIGVVPVVANGPQKKSQLFHEKIARQLARGLENDT